MKQIETHYIVENANGEDCDHSFQSFDESLAFGRKHGFAWAVKVKMSCEYDAAGEFLDCEEAGRSYRATGAVVKPALLKARARCRTCGKRGQFKSPRKALDWADVHGFEHLHDTVAEMYYRGLGWVTLPIAKLEVAGEEEN